MEGVASATPIAKVTTASNAIAIIRRIRLIAGFLAFRPGIRLEGSSPKHGSAAVVCGSVKYLTANSKEPRPAPGEAPCREPIVHEPNGH